MICDLQVTNSKYWETLELTSRTSGENHLVTRSRLSQTAKALSNDGQLPMEHHVISKVADHQQRKFNLSERNYKIIKSFPIIKKHRKPTENC